MHASSGFDLWPGKLDGAAQRALADEVLALAKIAPPFQAQTPGGGRMSVAITNLGEVGWVSDRAGYRYAPIHPLTGAPWPPIPRALLDLWRELADPAVPPDACLVNFYDPQARMGLHRDEDEADFAFPVLSVSLGDTAVFRLGGLSRKGPTTTVRLASGDVCRLSGPGRLLYHGVDRVLAGSSRLLPEGGRINLTLRRARRA